jgi:hypothetical protein
VDGNSARAETGELVREVISKGKVEEIVVKEEMEWCGKYKERFLKNEKILRRTENYW